MQISGQRKKQKKPQAPAKPDSVPASEAPTGATPAVATFPGDTNNPTPTGMPAPTVPVVPLPPAQQVPAPADPFSVDALLQHLVAPRSSEPEPVYDTPHGPAGDGNVPFMEPALAAAATVPFSGIATDGGAQLNHVMQKFGFAIVANVLKETELASVERLWADDLRSIVDVDRSTDKSAVKWLLDDPVHRWPMDKLPLGTKSAADWGLPLGRAAWHCRGHPNVKATFAALFGDSRLCCGMDCVFFTNKPSVSGQNATATSRLWPHADQNSAVKPSGAYNCYQGVLYIWPADQDTSATVVWPRSHTLVYPQLMQRGFKSHFCMLADTEHRDFARNARRVAVPAGAMLLWNSRTVHQGWPGGARLAFPICYEPTQRRDHDALARKQQLVQKGKPTTHWASIGKEHSIARKDLGPLVKDGIAIHHAAHTSCIAASGALKPEIIGLL